MADDKKYQQKKDIFISYRRVGAELFAGQLRQSLEQKGYSVFLDVESIRPGTEFNEKLYEVIDNCKDFILILPKDGLDRCVNDRDWVRLEIERAKEKGKNIIPIRLRDFSMPANLPPSLDFLRHLHGLTPTTEYYEAFLEKLTGSLDSHPKIKPKWWMITLAAVILCMIGFFCFRHYSRYPHNKNQEQLVSRLITYLVLNSQNYDSANKYFLDGINETEKYVENKDSADNESLRVLLKNQKEKIGTYTVNDFGGLSELAGSPFDAADIESFPAYLQSSYDVLIDLIENVDRWVEAGWKDEKFIDYLELLKEYARLELEVLFYGMNETLLPVTNDSALEKLKTEYLPKITSMRHLTFLKDADAVKGKSEAAVSRQEEIFNTDIPKLYDELAKSLTGDNIELQLNIIRNLKEIYTDDPEKLEGLTELEEHALRNQERLQTIAEKQAEVEKKDVELEAAKNRLYMKFMPLETDEQGILWAKGTMFLDYDMHNEAIECFTLFAQHGDDTDQICAAAAMKYADYREDLSKVTGGVVVFGHEPDLEPQDVEIGDIIYAVDGHPTANYSEFNAYNTGEEQHAISVLRFYDTGWDLLETVFDPAKGRLLLRSLIYENN